MDVLKPLLQLPIFSHTLFTKFYIIILLLVILAVVLESTAAAPSFRGFLIQARLVADDTTVVGQFEEPPAGGEYRYGSCTKREVENMFTNS